MTPVLTAFAYGALAVLVLVMGLILWAAWASRDVLYPEDVE